MSGYEKGEKRILGWLLGELVLMRKSLYSGNKDLIDKLAVRHAS